LILIGFQLLSIEQDDKNEYFAEIYDFRNAPRQSRAALQPTDIGWNPNDGKYFIDYVYIYILIIYFFKEHCFASASTTGLLNIWDASQLAMISQFKIHNATINRLQFHPTSKKFPIYK
jgi:WD40 repeat protein